MALIAALAVLLAALPVHAQQQGPVAQAQQAFRGLDLEGKDGPFAAVGLDLAQLYYEYQAYQQGAAAVTNSATGGFQPQQTLLPVQNGRVRIDAVATESASTLLAELEALGLARGAAASPVVSGWLPIEALAEAAQLGTLRFARPSLAKVQRRNERAQAPIVSQGVQAMHAAEARDQLGVAGNGTLVGILSDSFDCEGDADEDVADDELPPDVIVLADEEGCGSGTDEGRAMAQIVFDVAPEADIAFSSAFNGLAGFAQGIRDLADEGAEVIVDDVIYFGEPMFATGPVAAAANDVFDRGVAYFSSAGNSDGQSYESEDGFRDSGQEGPLGDGPLHDFDPGGGVDAYQNVTLPVGASVTISLQWVAPYPSAGSSQGAPNDLDLVLVDSDGNVVASADFDNVANDPVEVLQYENDGSTDADGDGTPDATFRLGIELADGPAPDELMKYVYSAEANDQGEGFSLNEYDARHSTVYGHANTRGAEAVGAAPWFCTPAFNSAVSVVDGQVVIADPGCDAGQGRYFPAFSESIIEPFSALGGTPLYYDESGARRAEPLVPAKPEVVGPDGGDNTFFGQSLGADPFGPLGDDSTVPNFFGTSAAAPHVAGVAALMLALNPDLTPARLYQILQETATGMSPGSVPADDAPDEALCPSKFDLKTGCGLINAMAALEAVPTTLRIASTELVTVDGETQVRIQFASEEPERADHFEIAHCFGSCSAGDASFRTVTTIEAVDGQSTYTATLGVPTPGRYTLLVRQVNDDGSISMRTVEVTVEPEGAFALTEAFPNPFQVRTELRLIVGEEESLDVTATLYDALGRRLRTFFDATVEGQAIIPLQAEGLSSGVYFIRVESEDFLETRSVVLVR